MDRYAGKPFLRLLECYILNSINKLDEEQLNNLVRMEPKLAQLYGCNGSWDYIIAKQMDFPDTLPSQINNIWVNYQEHAARQGGEADPQKFSIDFVNQNFSDYI